MVKLSWLLRVAGTRAATNASLLVFLLHLRAQALLLFPEFRSELWTEILCFKDRSNLNLGFLKWRSLYPIDSFFHRLHLLQPVAGN